MYMYTHRGTRTDIDGARCGDREMVGGVSENRPAVEVDNFESSFNLSHPPEHLFSSLPSREPRVPILRP